jgi:hypothetical protein
MLAWVTIVAAITALSAHGRARVGTAVPPAGASARRAASITGIRAVASGAAACAGGTAARFIVCASRVPWVAGVLSSL